MGGIATPWFILGLVALAILALKGYIPLSLSGRPKPSLGSPRSSERAPATPLDEVPADELGMAFARAKRREAEDDVAKAVLDRAGKTIKEAFTAPFSVAGDPGDPDAKS
jgi:hypothetical protein